MNYNLIFIGLVILSIALTVIGKVTLTYSQERLIASKQELNKTYKELMKVCPSFKDWEAER